MKIPSLLVILSLPLSIFAQDKSTIKLEEGKFFVYPELMLLASQIDGDNASGYNKLGFQLGVNTGLGLSNDKTISFQLALSQRGSRRSFNPDEPSMNAFHIIYNSLDMAVLYGKMLNSFYLQGGLRGTYLLSISESEGYVLNIANDYKQLGFILDTRANYPISDQFWLSATFQYSLMSLLNSSVSQVNYLQGGGGAFMNVLGVGIVWKP